MLSRSFSPCNAKPTATLYDRSTGSLIKHKKISADTDSEPSFRSKESFTDANEKSVEQKAECISRITSLGTLFTVDRHSSWSLICSSDSRLSSLTSLVVVKKANEAGLRKLSHFNAFYIRNTKNIFTHPRAALGMDHKTHYFR
jgi:hypothetical protein